MAKRRIQDDETQGDDIEIEDEPQDDATVPVTSDETADELAPIESVDYFAPELAAAEPTFNPAPDTGESLYRVQFALPLGVLVALLDPQNDLADVAGAADLGLLNGYAPSAIGEKVLSGFDRTAVGHKMATAQRSAHNRAIDADKRGAFR